MVLSIEVHNITVVEKIRKGVLFDTKRIVQKNIKIIEVILCTGVVLFERKSNLDLNKNLKPFKNFMKEVINIFVLKGMSVIFQVNKKEVVIDI